MLDGKTRDDCPNVSTACNNCILNNKTHILPWKYTSRRLLKLKTARRGLKCILSQADTQLTQLQSTFNERYFSVCFIIGEISYFMWDKMKYKGAGIA
jgi:hypothetical protein